MEKLTYNTYKRGSCEKIVLQGKKEDSKSQFEKTGTMEVEKRCPRRTLFGGKKC
jgi:hypothetical protein